MKEIAISQGKIALVDDDDFQYISSFKWAVCKSCKTFYAIRYARNARGHQTSISMHRTIMTPPIGMEIDHINGDGLDNRKENLRFVTHRENMQNYHKPDKTSKFPGVTWDKRDKKWIARIRVGKKRFTLGYFDIEIDAVNAYRNACEHPELIPPPKCKSSIYLGVHWCKRDRRWIAQIRISGKQQRLGSFTNEIDAAIAYHKASEIINGK